MSDGVEPFGVPRQYPGPHLVALVGSDFAFEGTGHGAEFDGEGIIRMEDAAAMLVSGLVDADGEEGAQ